MIQWRIIGVNSGNPGFEPGFAGLKKITLIKRKKSCQSLIIMLSWLKIF